MVFGNGIPRKFGLVVEVLKKMTALVFMVSITCTPVPGGLCAAQGVVPVPPATVQVIATPIPPVGGAPHEVLLNPIFPIYPLATEERGA